MYSFSILEKGIFIFRALSGILLTSFIKILKRQHLVSYLLFEVIYETMTLSNKIKFIKILDQIQIYYCIWIKINKAMHWVSQIFNESVFLTIYLYTKDTKIQTLNRTILIQTKYYESDQFHQIGDIFTFCIFSSFHLYKLNIMNQISFIK